MKATDIKIYGSNKPGTADGQAQTDQLLWLGDRRSSTLVKNYKAATGLTIPGITITTTGVSVANPDGNGSLIFLTASNTLQWQAFGDTAGPLVTFTADATKVLYSNNSDYSIEVTVVFATLDAEADTTDTITIADHADLILNIFPHITSAQATAGNTAYRAIWHKNEHATESLKIAKAFIKQITPSTDDSWKFAMEDPTDRISNIVIQEVADVNTSPTGRTWNNVTTEGTAIAIEGAADLAAGESTAIWFERTVTAGATAYKDNNIEISFFGDIENLEN
jgi:hypothetical protein